MNFDPEEVTERALELLKQEHFIPEFIHIPKNDFVDKQGIDFLVFLGEEGVALPLQITGDKNCVKRHLERHSHVPWILVVDRNRPKFFAKKIRKKIIFTLSQLRRNGHIPHLNAHELVV